MQNIFDVDPRDTHKVRKVLKEFLNNSYSDLVEIVDRANVLQRWDVNSWEISYFLVVSPELYARFYFIEDDARRLTFNWLRKDGENITSSFERGSWRDKDHLQGFSPISALRERARSIVHVFDNPRVFDNLFHACEIGQRHEGADYIFVSVDKEKSLIDPVSFYSEAHPIVVEVHPHSLHRHHIIKGANPRVATNALLTFGGKMLPEAKPTGKVLLVSLEAEKRMWVNQVNCISALIRKMKPDLVLINGMTGPAGGTQFCKFDEQKALEQKIGKAIAQECGFSVGIESLFGLPLQQKIERFRDVSLFVGPAGSACLVPNMMSIPSIVVGNKSLIKWRRDLDRKSTIRVPEWGIKETQDQGIYSYDWGVASDYVSYSIDENALMETFEKVYPVR